MTKPNRPTDPDPTAVDFHHPCTAIGLAAGQVLQHAAWAMRGTIDPADHALHCRNARLLASTVPPLFDAIVATAGAIGKAYKVAPPETADPLDLADFRACMSDAHRSAARELDDVRANVVRALMATDETDRGEADRALAWLLCTQPRLGQATRAVLERADAERPRPGTN